MLKIVVKNRKTLTENSYQFKKNTIVIGRGRQCDIVLESDTVSRQHCQIHSNRDELLLEDLGSGNGTFINNKALPAQQKVPLHSGDRIRIEDFEMDWQLDKPLPEFKKDSPIDSTDPDILEIKMIKKVIGAMSGSQKTQLIVVSEPFEGKTLALEDSEKTFTIGRELDCDLALDSPVLSRKHAQISCKWGTFVIQDLQSKNGTFVNGVAITTETSLKDKDQILFGTVQAVFHHPDSVNFAEIAKSLHDEKPKPEPTPEESQSLAAKKMAEAPVQEVAKPEPPKTTPPAPPAPAKPAPAAESSEDILKTFPDEKDQNEALPATKSKSSAPFLKALSVTEWALLGFAVLVIAIVIAALVFIF